MLAAFNGSGDDRFGWNCVLFCLTAKPSFSCREGVAIGRASFFFNAMSVNRRERQSP
jgi:hypothetical protein